MNKIPGYKKRVYLVSGNFVIDPIEDGLGFWLACFPGAFDIIKAPYNQMLQSLHSPHVIQSSGSVTHIILLRMEEWQNLSEIRTPQDAEQNLDFFAQQIAEAAKKTGQDYLVFLCPNIRNTISSVEYQQQCIHLENLFQDSDSVEVINYLHYQNVYKVAEIGNDYGDEVAHMPYSEEMYQAMATLISRKIYNRYFNGYKVIAVDCDNTLWQGVCAEQSLTELTIGSGDHYLQTTLKQLQLRGMLIVLVSKNNPTDVWPVFSDHPQMVLRKSDIADFAINWQAKSDNLVSLANSLSLHLKDFIFIDDNPVECAEVRANCPDVLVVELPADEAIRQKYLQQVWALDLRPSRGISGSRTKLYQQEKQRKQLYNDQQNFEEFINALNLVVKLQPAKNSDIPRLIELSRRTNQFNFIKKPLDTLTITQYMTDQNSKLFVVYVHDRFGDYGLVGLLKFNLLPKESLHLQLCLLSCRVLGRGVEHRIFSRIGEYAYLQQFKLVSVDFKHTERNAPAKTFLENLKPIKKVTHDGVSCYYFHPKQLIELKITSSLQLRSDEVKQKKPAISKRSNKVNWQNSLYETTTNNLNMQDIFYAIRESLGKFKAPSADASPTTDANEKAWLELFSSILRYDKVDLDKDFFSFSATSLQAVRILAEIYRIWRVKVSLETLYSGMSLRSLLQAVVSDKQNNSDNKVQRAHADKYMPLSWEQELLWFSMNNKEMQRNYHIAVAFSLKGSLDVEKLKHAIEKLCNQHDILNIRFGYQGNKPIQFVCEKNSADFSVLSGDPSKLFEAEVSRSFDILQDAMCRFSLIAVEKDWHILVMIFNHLIIDEWALTVLYAELSALYSGHEIQRQPLSYLAYVEKQANKKSVELEKNEVYWRERFLSIASLTPVLSQYFVKKNGADGAGVFKFWLPVIEVKQLQRIASIYKLSRQSILLANFFDLLYKYTSKENLYVATPIIHRDAENYFLLGLLSTLLPIILKINPLTSFISLAREIQTLLIEARNHQEFKLSRLLSDIQRDHDRPEEPSYSALFNQIGFVLYDRQEASLNFENINAKFLSLTHNQPKFDLLLVVESEAYSIEFTIYYSKNCFNREFISQFSTHFNRLLKNSLGNASSKIKKLSMLPRMEKLKIASFQSPYPINVSKKSLLDLFEAQVNKSPDNIAVQCGTVELTYQALHKYAMLFSAQLRQKIGAPPVVGIFLPKSCEFVIAILALLALDAAYLPFDVEDSPSERIKAIMSDANVSIVLTFKAYQPRLVRLGLKCICIDDLLKTDVSDVDAIPGKIRSSDALAYIIYTSGSSGTPKKVSIKQSLVVALIKNLHFIKIRANMRISQLSSLAFDAAVFEIWGALLNGACLVIPPPLIHSDRSAFITFLRTSKINLSFITTALFSHTIRHDPNAFESLDQVLIGGEELQAATIEALPTHKRAKYYNCYGPTEATVFSTLYPITRPESCIPIGFPIGGKRALILDNNQQQLPAGVWGEIYIGGEGLDEKYADSVLVSGTRMRLYRTGDRGRWREKDGAIEFGGRLDRQVKLRGYRIDLSEVEASIKKFPSIYDAYVQLDKKTIPRLVAYIQLMPNVNTTLKAIKQELKLDLPKYMLPSQIFIVDQFPTSSRGKISIATTCLGKKYIAKNAVELKLLEIFQSLLHLDNITKDGDFFSNGGDSLLFASLLYQVNMFFGVRLEGASLFKDATIARFAKLIAAQLSLSSDNLPDCVLPLQLSANNNPHLFLFPPVTGLPNDYFSLSQMLSDWNVYGLISPLLLERHKEKFLSVESIGRYYVKALKAMQKSGPYYLGGWSFGGLLAISVAAILESQGETVEKLYLLDPYNLSQLSKNKLAEIANTTPQIQSNNTMDKVIEEHFSLASKFTPTIYTGSVSFVVAANDTEKFSDPLKARGWSDVLKNATVSFIHASHQQLLAKHNLTKIHALFCIDSAKR